MVELQAGEVGAINAHGRWHRDAKIYTTVFEGASEIQRLVISRAISGMRIR